MSGRHFQQIFMSVLTELQLYKYVFERDFVHTQNKSPKIWTVKLSDANLFIHDTCKTIIAFAKGCSVYSFVCLNRYLIYYFFIF